MALCPPRTRQTEHRTARPLPAARQHALSGRPCTASRAAAQPGLKQEPQGPRGCTAEAAQGLLQHPGVKGRAQATSQSASGRGALGLPASSTSHSHTVR